MSGTEDKNFVALNSQSAEVTQVVQQSQPGAETTEGGNALTQSERMNQMIRSSSPKTMQREIEKLRKESAKYRTSSRDEANEKLEIIEKAREVQQELDALKAQHRTLKIMRALDSAGCIKSELVAKDIPDDCKDFDEYIKTYKVENGFLFNSARQKQSRGGAHKPSTTVNLTPSQQMDMSIRKALGR